MRKRLILHITYSGFVWSVKLNRKLNGLIQSNYLLKVDAVQAAVGIARASMPSQIIIHKRNGQFQSERTYGRDPIRTKG